MRHIKRYRELFEELDSPAMEQLEFLNSFVKGSWKLNSETGLVDVDGNFFAKAAGLETLIFVNFGEVNGSFNCSHNQLTSLEGSPQEVGKNFYCHKNRLTTLEGAPEKVGEDFYCFNNQLTSLRGAPQEVGGLFYLDDAVGFRWTTEGKIEHAVMYPQSARLILPTVHYDSLLDAVPNKPTLLKAVEDFDKVMYNKLLKDLGWDKMGPDLLRQLKNGII